MKKHHKFHKMSIDMHKDGSSTSHLHHEDGADHDVHAGHGDHDALMDHIMDHTSAPNPGEAAAAAGPAAGEAAVGSPMPGAAAPAAGV